VPESLLLVENASPSTNLHLLSLPVWFSHSIFVIYVFSFLFLTGSRVLLVRGRVTARKAYKYFGKAPGAKGVSFFNFM
jgi:hypothetical protein